jgi:UDP-glucose 4-epimerase
VRAAVTGGAGFIGSHVVDALVARGDDVHVIDNFATGRRENLSDAASVHEHDIRAPLGSLLDEIRPEVVVHLAAQADVGTSVAQPLFDAEVNVVGTLNVLEAARPHGAQLIFSSTGGAIYGECERPAREEDERRPLSPYGTAKLAAEEYLATWNRLHGTSHVALSTDRLRAGEAVTIFGDGEQTRDYVYVGDVVAAVLAAMGGDGGVYNVGTGTETSVNELFDECRRIAGVEAEATHAPARPGDVLRSVLDVSRAERALAWRPQTSLAEGLALTWAA